jgi:hypothetical protein
MRITLLGPNEAMYRPSRKRYIAWLFLGTRTRLRSSPATDENLARTLR